MRTDAAAPCRWTRLREAVGPTAAGLIGGSLTGFLALPNLAPLCRNMAATYEVFPSAARPWLANDFSVPVWVNVLMAIVGSVGPMGIGAAAVWLARSRDTWSDLSAGLSASVAATLSAFAAGVGWPVVLALVVVPSISDLTVLSESPSPESLARRYPDLAAVEPAKRGERLMPKIVADQAAGGANAIWVGLILSGLTAGSHALAGALAAGYLRRRGESLRSGVLPYLELTLPPMLTVALIIANVFTPAWEVLLGDNPFTVGWPSLFALTAGSVLIVYAVVKQWPGWLRLGLGLTWYLVLMQTRLPNFPWPLVVAAIALLGVLLARFWIRESATTATSPGAV